MEKLDPIPDLIKYPRIRRAKDEGKLVIFVGAGLSALWGCKRWKEMAVVLIEACYARGRKLSYWEKESLITKYASSPRRLITIAKEILGDDYYAELKGAIQPNPNKQTEMPELFKSLVGFNATYLTTNIDGHLTALFDKGSSHTNPKQFAASLLKPNQIVHLHGIIDDPQTLVLTIDEYIGRYNDPTFRKFLTDAFLDETLCFLFLGYGLDELEIIDFLIEKNKEGQLPFERFVNRLYILLPFFQNELSLLKYETQYFNKFNMTVIPYPIDTNGHDQLYEVISRWRQQFEKPVTFYESYSIVEKHL